MPIRSLFDAIASSVSANKKQEREAKLYRNLMRHEARVGGTVFGPIPAGRRREFFCLDEHTWVWHEEWTDQNNKHQVMTTRYDVRPNGVLKSQNGSHYQPVKDQEALRLLKATRLYRDKINQQIYNFA
jgi:hypothetical protein